MKFSGAIQETAAAAAIDFGFRFGGGNGASERAATARKAAPAAEAQAEAGRRLQREDDGAAASEAAVNAEKRKMAEASGQTRCCHRSTPANGRSLALLGEQSSLTKRLASPSLPPSVSLSLSQRTRPLAVLLCLAGVLLLWSE